MRFWWLGADPEGSEWQRRELKELKAHGKGWIAEFVGVDDRNAAESIEGLYFAAERAALPKTHRDEYYWADLVGLRVEDPQGELLGTVKRLIETGANAVLVIDGYDGVERLVPFVAQVIQGVDVAGGRIRADWGRDW